MARFADVPYYLLDDYFEETHEGVAHEDIVAGLVYSICR